MHVMLDYETLGNTPCTTVVSLGLTCFNRSGILDKKYFEFDLNHQIKSGRSVKASTLEWWMNQKDSARAVFKTEPNKPKILLPTFFNEYESFVSKNLSEIGEKWDQVKPWGNGANFDVSITEHLYHNHHEKGEFGIPWKFWNVMCFRTFAAITGAKDLVKRQGVHHNALDDAVYQTECVLAVWNKKATKKSNDSIKNSRPGLRTRRT